MPLYGQGGPLSYKPNAAATAIGGIGSMLSAYAEAKQRKKDLAQDDALKIWAMAQKDPLVMQTPEAKSVFEKAGWPMPQLNPVNPEGFIASLPKGYQGSYGIDPLTGQATGYKVTPQNRMLDASRRASIERPIPLRGMDGQTYLYFPVTGEIKSIDDMMLPETAPGSAVPQQPGPGSAPATPNPFQSLTDQWLAPDTTGAFGPRPSPPMAQPTAPAPAMGTPAMQNLEQTMTGLLGQGYPVPMPRGAKRQKQPAPVGQPAQKEPATQQEFEQTVREMAKTDRQKAKAYYDKWVSKWQ